MAYSMGFRSFMGRWHVSALLAILTSDGHAGCLSLDGPRRCLLKRMDLMLGST
jgi:hypothetical protein